MLLNDPREYGSKFLADCRREWTDEQFKMLDKLGTKAFLSDERRREKLTEMATLFRFGRRMERKFGTGAEIRDKLEIIKANTETLIKSLNNFPLWPYFGRISQNGAETELTDDILGTLPAALAALKIKTDLAACKFGIAVAKKKHLKYKRLTSNAQDWVTYNFFRKLFMEMDKWDFKVYQTKKETRATKFVMHYCSLVEPTWKVSLSQFSKAVKAFESHPERMNEIKQMDGATALAALLAKF